ncbi:MAG: type VI secretion system tip protein TssI/VgrG [Myxococcota bacterium]
MRAAIIIEGLDEPFTVRALDGTEEVGEPARFTVEVSDPTKAIADARDLVGRAVAVRLHNEFGQRLVHATVREVTRVYSVAGGGVAGGGANLHRFVVTSALARLGLRRDSRVFQHQTGPQIVTTLLDEVGADPPGEALAETYPELASVTQYDEASLPFLRRVCETEGFWFFDEGERVGLCDAVSAAPEVELDDALLVTEETGLDAGRPRAWGLQTVTEGAAAEVVALGYDFRHPAVTVRGKAASDDPVAARQRHVAPHVTTPEAATRAARIRLEGLRARTERLRFRCSTCAILPGHRFVLDHAPERVEPEQFCVRVAHRYRVDDGYVYTVTSAPASRPFRLAPRTRKPKISGVQSAIVTGPPGQEIHTDADGCVTVRFHWDRFGPTDHQSSRPVRVLQPNLGGSMLLPRVGWEVWVAFEHGDPDRPFVIGRAYNGKHMPPAALPANKTKSMLSTSSSPGAATGNSISWEDEAGRQGLHFFAGKGLTKSVGNNAVTQTVADEKVSIKGDLALTVGANQTESVHVARVVESASQSITVAGTHTVKTPKANSSKVASETVSCAVLTEQVGSPGGGLEALAKQAAMAVGGEVGGPAFAVAKTAYEAHEAYQKGGAEAAAKAAAKGVAGMIPMAGTAVDVLDAGKHGPFADDPADTKKKEGSKGARDDAGVGGAAAAGSGGASQGGGGNRVFDISGAATEAIGGAYCVATGGENKWTTLGASTVAVGGPHATSAGKVSWVVGGASVHSTGAFSVTSAGPLTRKTRAATTTAATLSMNAGSGIELHGKGSVALTCGVLNVAGKLVLDANGTKVTVDGSGLTIEGATVSFDGPVMCKQSDRS